MINPRNLNTIRRALVKDKQLQNREGIIIRFISSEERFDFGVYADNKNLMLGRTWFLVPRKNR